MASTVRIKRQNYVVQLRDDTNEDGYLEYVVSIVHGDRMRAELEGPRHGLTDLKAQSMNFTGLWVWCALVRTGLYDKAYKDFTKTDLVDLNVSEDPIDVNPTQADTSA